MQEGTYDIGVVVKSSYSATTVDAATASYTVLSRVTGNTAVISPTTNPLVALYSAPPSSGTSMYVQFAQVGPGPSWTDTAAQPIAPGQSTNFLVAGMLPNTTYLMRDVLNNGTTSVPLPFTTGSLPTDLVFPTVTDPQPPTASTDLTENMIYHTGVGGSTNKDVEVFSTDLSGNVNWFYDPVANNFPAYGPTLVPGGTVLLLGGTYSGAGGAQVLREINLAGEPLRETNVAAVNAELAAMGQNSILDFDHDAVRLPNGDTAVIALTSEVINVNGTPTTYNGNMVIVLDKNFQVSWVWNAFNWLSTSRLPTDGEGPSDWLHANSLDYSPSDGNLIVSLRPGLGAQDRLRQWHRRRPHRLDAGAGGQFHLECSSRGPGPVVLPPARRDLYQRHDHPGVR